MCCLELVHDGGDQVVGVRFSAVDVGRESAIRSAHVQFSVDEVSDEPTSLEIRAHAVASAPSFRDADNDISSRELTKAVVRWEPAPWR